ncbi:hypothetical protein F4827_002183 [Paraburkholderia bannensis]|uniref:DUF4148 domain-containing protein n=1 Tax=Paraburkholderia bannensis TaxID=765414 RepID=A0A7W9TVY0_9BURK|nr:MULTISPECIES: DUF4148 domain-containing protein [Paraburkholderia]MBB3257270.1 hypothetical protein [Paraburkholderia sp. WP4_3_2]MBB6102334.1 hypothetical protein [Paraburkholderia bannensis]
MKLVQTLLVAVAVAVPAVSFAQSNEPLTRAQVRAELVQLEKAGYNPAADYTQYPQNLQTAQARVDAQNQAAASAYGSGSNGNSAAGARAVRSAANRADTGVQNDVVGLEPIYSHS